MTEEQLKGYDIILMLDKSGSMEEKLSNGKTRWEQAQESTIAWARQAEKYDSNGITVIPFAGTWKEYQDVTGGGDKVKQIFKENSPAGSTNTHLALEYVLNKYLTNAKTAKPILILCVTDGAPTDEVATAKVIAAATHRMERDEQIGIQFLQIGNDPGATKFLKMLDDDLVSKYGAKFDIVDTNTFEEAEVMSFGELLIKTLED